MSSYLRTARLSASLALWLGSCACGLADELPTPMPDVRPKAELPCCAEPVPAHVWASAEYLNWWTSGNRLAVPMVTTGPIDTLGSGQRPGTLGLPGTQIVLGSETIAFDYSIGGRFNFGGWLNPARSLGIEGNYFFLADMNAHRAGVQPGTAGSAALSVPFYDVTVGAESSTGIAYPRSVAPFGGSYRLDLTTRVQGGEANLLALATSGGGFDLQFLAGFRYFCLEDALDFTTNSINVPPALPDVFQTQDHFKTRNDFYAGQIGAKATYGWKQLDLSVLGKVAIGNMQQTYKTNGQLATNDFTNLGPVQVFNGGYFAQPTNSGVQHLDRFAVMPEVDLTLGYQPTECLRFSFGYSFLYVNNVARAGEQIDHRINPTQNPSFFGDPSGQLRGPVSPEFLLKSSEFWAHGLHFGLEVRF